MVELTGQMPSALRRQARWVLLGPANVPALLVHPGWETSQSVPVVIWMHGRTVIKETDPGRYLRLMRAGIGVCAVDLPGHGERYDADLQHPDQTYELVQQMHDEIDGIVEALTTYGEFDTTRMGIGGMSAGGMTALARLCSEHRFCCASVEATSGSWQHQMHRSMFQNRDWQEIQRLNPLDRIENWREIPLQAFHSIRDEWVAFEGQEIFINALRQHYRKPELVEFITYEQTGAPYEHAGFGKMAADAKDRQRDFFQRWLIKEDLIEAETGNNNIGRFSV